MHAADAKSSAVLALPLDQHRHSTPGDAPQSPAHHHGSASLGLALTLLLSCLSSAAAAQGSGQSKDIVGRPISIHHAQGGTAVPNVTAPPRFIAGTPSPHRDLPLPIGHGNAPLPSSPPSMESAAPAAFTYFLNSVCKPAGAATLYLGEPSCALSCDVAFQTGNQYAATSIDQGMTWVHTSPYTTFPASDGGFCCDQRALHVPSRDIVVWLLQYTQGAVHNRYRIAVARGRNNLKSATWYYYDWTPEDFGYPAQRWLDFPDLAYAQDHLHVSANVYDFANPNNYVGSVRWAINLDNLRDQAGFPGWSYATSAALGGGSSYRFTQGVTGTKIWYGTLINTTTLRVYEFDESTAVSTWNDRTVAAIVNTAASAPGPDLRDWAGRCVGRIRGAFGSTTEVGFMYGSNINGAARPQAYTRVSRFRTADRTLIADDDIWNPTSAFLYAAGCTNDTGATGAVLVIGGGTVYPHSAALIVPAGGAFSGLTATTISTGTHGPAGNQWGDYFTVARHPYLRCSWIATGMAQNGSPNNADSEPRYIWFGDGPGCAPPFPLLTVTSTPFQAVPIAMAQTDLDGRKDGNTTFVRRYAPRQGYTLSAPLTRLNGGIGYVFDRWVIDNVARPVGLALIDVPEINILGSRAEARYLPVRELYVGSTYPSSGITISVSVVDLLGTQNGVTTFTRYYKDLTTVTLTAPGTNGTLPFKRWRVNGIEQSVGDRSATLPMDRNTTAVADYYQYSAGSFAPFGSGCAGTNGVDVQGTVGVPELGNMVAYTLTGGRPSSVTLLVLGSNRTNWLGLPLPLVLGTLAPGCTLYVPLDVLLSRPTTAAGAARFDVTIPTDVNLIDGHFFTQNLCLDQGANPINLTFSNAVDTKVGGLF